MHRSLLKAISWETFSNVLVLILAWLMFGHFEMCVIFGLIAFLMKIFFFVLHEWLWEKI